MRRIIASGFVADMQFSRGTFLVTPMSPPIAVSATSNRCRFAGGRPLPIHSNARPLVGCDEQLSSITLESKDTPGHRIFDDPVSQAVARMYRRIQGHLRRPSLPAGAAGRRLAHPLRAAGPTAASRPQWRAGNSAPPSGRGDGQVQRPRRRQRTATRAAAPAPRHRACRQSRSASNVSSCAFTGEISKCDPAGQVCCQRSAARSKSGPLASCARALKGFSGRSAPAGKPLSCHRSCRGVTSPRGSSRQRTRCVLTAASSNPGWPLRQQAVQRREQARCNSRPSTRCAV